MKVEENNIILLKPTVQLAAETTPDMLKTNNTNNAKKI